MLKDDYRFYTTQLLYGLCGPNFSIPSNIYPFKKQEQTHTQTNKTKQNHSNHTHKKNWDVFVWFNLSLNGYHEKSIPSDKTRAFLAPEVDPGHNLCSSTSNPGEHCEIEKCPLWGPGKHPGKHGAGEGELPKKWLKHFSFETWKKNGTSIKNPEWFWADLTFFRRFDFLFSVLLPVVFFLGGRVEMIHKFDKYISVQKE